jgi:hypothetical protein
MTDLDAARQRAEAALSHLDDGTCDYDLEGICADVLALCGEVERLRKIETAAKEIFELNRSPYGPYDFSNYSLITVHTESWDAFCRAVSNAKEAEGEH